MNRTPGHPLVRSSLVILLLLTLPGCEVVGDIFKAGVWVGIVAVVVIVGLVWWLVAKMRR